MQTINISLPTQLKSQAHQLIDDGYYVSFSDLVRSALRKLVAQSEYDQLSQEARKEYKSGKTSQLKTNKDIDKFVESLAT